MPTPYKGRTIPAFSDTADAPKAFQDFVDDGPIPTFADSGSRAADWAAPPEGSISYLESSKQFEAHDGAGWRDFTSFILPPGVILPSASLALPQGFLWAAGQEVQISAYDDLYNAIGTQYGSASPGYFRLPATNKRVLVGDIAQSGFNRGESGGYADPQLRQHDHPVSDTHRHPPGNDMVNFVTYQDTLAPGAGWAFQNTNQPVLDFNAFALGQGDFHASATMSGQTTSGSIDVQNEEHGDQANGNFPPYVTVSFIIKY